MHLLAATPGSIDDGQEPVDLQQTPADVVFLSAADTELAALAEARSEMRDPPGLRLANLMHLRHSMSVDLHIDSCALGARLVIARVLGGMGYWTYGVQQYAARLHEAGIPLALLPGDDKPDPDLRGLSTVADADYDALWSYLTEGGPANATRFLTCAQAIVKETPRPPGAAPLLRAGVYWPGSGVADLQTAQAAWTAGQPVVPIVFYRALVQGAGLNPINRLTRSLARAGLNPLPIFVASLKDPVSAATLDHLFSDAPPAVILNATAFAVGSPNADDPSAANPLSAVSAHGAPVFQIVLSGGTEEAWAEGLTGLSARDIAMNVALPEVDGRILARAVSFKGEAFFDEATQCPIASYRAQGDRIDFVTALAANWATLRATPVSDKRVALILANYPNKDGRLANGVGLDTPAGTVHVLKEMQATAYRLDNVPRDADALMQRLMAGPTNWLTDRAERRGGEALPLTAYRQHFDALPWAVKDQITTRWGAPESDPFFDAEVQAFKLSVLDMGHVVVGLQPARGYNIDPTETYHAPDLVPPHNYLAFYFWLRHDFAAHALVHMGKHGNMEWLPGKALALSETCWPEVVFGPTPHLYPFIVNDPGEGTQAKRRSQAVIIDHLTPPLTRAETYGPLRDLEALVDEYYEAAGVDPRRIAHLRREILSLTSTSGLDLDVGMTGEDDDTDLAKLDAYLCELKEAQIRDGLHVFGQSPEGTQARDLAIALVRVPRGTGEKGDASLLRAMAEDLSLGIDPLDCDMAAPAEIRPQALLNLSEETWRSTGDTVERLELLAQRLIDHGADHDLPATREVLEQITRSVQPAIATCGPDETRALLAGLEGQAIAPGPSGAPTRGRLDTLPTGRNFFSVDSRAVPTPTAWALGWKSANLLIDAHLQREGDWPRSLLLTAWGTSNMRTGGDDIAQAMALMGVKPTWDAANRRVTGFEIIPSSALGRPRVDVTLRISGFFRDAFPQLIALFDSAARAVQ
ncbi:MAG: cobaltochelatase subunit CobN, partial [Pseudomonadota bacterium]